MRHPFLSDFFYFSLKAVFRIEEKIHPCLFMSFSFFRLGKEMHDPFLFHIRLFPLDNVRVCLNTDRTVRMKTDQYLSIIFLSRRGNQRCHSDFHDFSLKAVVRSERKTDAYVFIYFPFVVGGGEMRHSFLLANQPFLFDIGSTFFEINHFHLIGHDFCERSRELDDLFIDLTVCFLRLGIFSSVKLET
jgi:hypothetical protein